MFSARTILLFISLFIFTHSRAQEKCSFIFSGKVIDEHNHPLSGAVILLSPSQAGQETDDQGNFRFTGLCAGRYKALVRFLGYEDVEIEVVVDGEVTRTISLTEVSRLLNEIVIQHHDDTHTEHATNFAQLDERQLAETAGKSLGETLKEIPGINSIQTGPGIFKPVIHGVHSQRVLVLNHGIRQEGQQWGAEHAPEIDPFIASNIIVIKDAAAIKYGSDALGGVVIVNPPALPDQAGLGGTVNTILQSNGRSATLSGMLEGGINKHRGWGWRVQGTAKLAGDFKTPDYYLTNTGIRESNFSAAAGYHREKRGLDVFFSHFQTEIGILKGSAISSTEDLANAMERPIPQYTSGFSYEIDEPYQSISHNLLKVDGHLQGAGGEWRMQYGFQNNQRKEFDIRKGQDSEIPAMDLELNTQTLQIEWEATHSGTRTLTAGVNGMSQFNRNIPGTQRIPFIPNFVSYSAGLFVITKLFLPNWILDLGARYDFRSYEVKGYDYKNSYYNTSFSFNNASATFGATRQLSSKQSILFNLSSAWRPPHVAELYSVGTHQSAAAIEYGLLLNDSTNEVMDIDDVNFKTEHALKFVTTFRSISDKISFEISPYLNYISNYIYLNPGGISKNIRGTLPYFRYEQTDALFLGADLSATWQAGKFIQIIPQVSLLRASDVTNNDYFIFIPPNRYDVALRYERPVLGSVRNFYVELKTRLVAEQNRAPRVIPPRAFNEVDDPLAGDDSNFDFMEAPDAYWLLNLAAGFSVNTKNVQYDFRIASENALNQKYREYTNRLRYYADEIGHNFILSFKCIF